jgi:hypothetical protein
VGDEKLHERVMCQSGNKIQILFTFLSLLTRTNFITINLILFIVIYMKKALTFLLISLCGTYGNCFGMRERYCRVYFRLPSTLNSIKVSCTVCTLFFMAERFAFYFSSSLALSKGSSSRSLSILFFSEIAFRSKSLCH